jgi:hypothetical protein
VLKSRLYRRQTRSKRGGRESKRGVSTRVVVLQSRRVRKSYEALKFNRRRVVKLGRPWARKDSDGDVAYVIGLDIMLVRASKLRIQLI